MRIKIDGKFLIIFLLLLAVPISSGSAYMLGMNAAYNEFIDFGPVKSQPINLIPSILENGFKDVNVELISDSDSMLSAEQYSYGGAFYLNKTDTIYIKHGAGIGSIHHEYGHHLWYKVLSEKEKEEYRQVFKESDNFVTVYAYEKGVRDDFAESYRNFMTEEVILPKAKKQFMYKLRQKYPALI